MADAAPRPHAIAAAVIAGGQARRMGGRPKHLEVITGQTIAQHVLSRIGPQCELVIFNGRQVPQGLHMPLVSDVWPDAGPLGGILSCMLWLQKERRTITHLLSVSADTPFLPRDLTKRLTEPRGPRPVSAESDGKRHGLVTLWPLALVRHAEQLFRGGERSVNGLLDRLNGTTVHFDTSPFDPFFNINTPQDLAKARRLADEVEASGL